ncbi:MAG: hypothetical protein EOP56_15125 [Sphingobacteriales bacterium]|nr:MAG: hypothetical protein EOP56_15125 [Sphingobacteriales bacterium]
MSDSQRGLISEIVSESALKQIDNLTAKLGNADDKIVALIKHATELSTALTSAPSFKDGANITKELQATLVAMEKLGRSYGQTATHAQIKTKSDKEQAKEIQTLIKDLKAQQKELEALADKYKKAQKAYNASESKRQAREEAQAFKERIAAHKLFQAELKKSIAATDKSIAANGRQIAALERETNRELEAIRRKSTAYAILESTHKRLKADALEIGAKFGAESKQFIDAAAAANVLDNRLKALHTQLGDHRRNVGNYSSALQGFNQQFTFMLTELPNAGISFRTFAMSMTNNAGPAIESLTRMIQAHREMVASGQKAIPLWKQLAGVVFSWRTALYLGIAAVTAWSMSSDHAAEKVKILTDKSDALREANKNVSNSFVKQATELQILKERFQDANASVERKEDVIRKLNKGYADTIGKIDSINEAEKFFVDRSEAFVKALTIRAQIEGAYDAIADNQKKLFDQSAKSASEATNWFVKYTTYLSAWQDTDEELSKRGKNIMNAGGEFDKVWNQKFAEQQEKTRKRLLNKTQNDVDKSNKVLKEFIKTQTDELNKLSKENGFGFDLDPKEKKGKEPVDYTNEELNAQERINKALAEERRIYLEDIKNKNQAIIDDEKESYQIRLQAAKDYAQAELTLNSLALGTDVENIAANLDKIEQIEAKSAATRTNEEKALLLQKEAFLAEFNAAVAKAKIEEGNIHAAAAKRVREITYQEQEDMSAAAVDGAEKIAKYYEQMAEDRIKTEKLTGKKAADARKQALKQTLQDTIEYLETMAAVADITGESIDKIREAITKLQEQVNKTDSKDSMKGLRDAIDYAKIGVEALNNVFDTFTNSAKDDFEQLLSIAQSTHDTTIAMIDATAISEEEKARRVAMAEMELQRTREEIAARQRQDAVRRAAFEKANALFEIAIKTTLAIIEAAKMGDWIKVGLISVLSATQTAKVLATPIPQYAEGTGPEGHPGGPMVVGDGGKREYIITRTGEVYETPDVPTLITAPKLTAPGTDVIKDFPTFLAAQANNVGAAPSDAFSLDLGGATVGAIKDLKGSTDSQTRKLQDQFIDQKVILRKIHNRLSERKQAFSNLFYDLRSHRHGRGK